MTGTNQNKDWTRICPVCGQKIYYTSPSGIRKAIQKNSPCMSCAKRKHKDPNEYQPENWIRTCPNCGEPKSYKSFSAWKTGIQKNASCKRCTAEKTGFTDRFSAKGKNKGKNNPFYGKTHTEKTKAKIKEANSGRIVSQKRKDELSKTMSGKNNPMYGKSIYQAWVEKYGKTEADIKMEKLKQKQSKNTKGKNNPMYGKAPPQKTGNGWSGWYKGWYFRSLRELAYMIKEIEAKGLEWESAEKKAWRIPYINANKTERTYAADFLVEKTRLIEIKPEKLQQTRATQAKAEAAKIFCKKQGWSYELVDPGPLDLNTVNKLHQAGDLIFIDRYERLFQAQYAGKIRTVYVLKGTSGSGKTTYANNLIKAAKVGITCAVVSADHYMVDDKGKYKFKPKKLSEVHNRCFKAFFEAIEKDTNIIIVDNTNTRDYEVSPYVSTGIIYGYEIRVIYLECSIDNAINRNTHNVPQKTIMKQKSRLKQKPEYTFEIIEEYINTD